MEVKLPSNISGHWLWKDPVRFQWWILLLQNVAEEDVEIVMYGKRHIVSRGCIIVTEGELAKLWSTTPNTAKGFMRKLIKMGELERRPNGDRKLTELFVCNIDEYIQVRPNVDRKLTESDENLRNRPNVDRMLTELNSNESKDSSDDRPNVDRMVTEKEKEKRNEKESFPPHPPYKEKENKKEKDLSISDEMLCRPAGADDSVADFESGIDFNKLRDFFNAQMEGKMIPQIRALLNKRRKAVLARSKEYGKEAIRDAIVNAANSAFLNGKNNRCFVASFDWIFCPNNFPKVLENNYSDELNNQPTNPNGTTNQNFRPKYGLSASDEKQQRDAEFAAHIAERIARSKKPNGS